MRHQKSSLPQEGRLAHPLRQQTSSLPHWSQLRPPMRHQKSSVGENIQSRLTGGSAKRDVENILKCTRLNFILAPRSRPLGLVKITRKSTHICARLICITNSTCISFIICISELLDHFLIEHPVILVFSEYI